MSIAKPPANLYAQRGTDEKPGQPGQNYSDPRGQVAQRPGQNAAQAGDDQKTGQGHHSAQPVHKIQVDQRGGQFEQYGDTVADVEVVRQVFRVVRYRTVELVGDDNNEGHDGAFCLGN